MARKIDACVIAPRHKWEFVKNVTTATNSLRSASFVLRGIYRCAHCNRRKYGAFQHEGQSQSGGGIMKPDFEAVKDKRMSELTPAQQDDAKELWLRNYWRWCGASAEHIRFLLDRLDKAREDAERRSASQEGTSS